MIQLSRNIFVRLFALAVILYSIGFPMPVLGRNPCTRWFPVALYVALPREMCFVPGAGWVNVP